RVRIVARTAGPEPGHVADHQPAMRAQPIPITGRQEVLPLRYRDIRVDVNLALPQYIRGVRGLLSTLLWIGLPRKHGSGQAALLCTLARGPEGTLSEVHQRPGSFGMEQQQRGENPGIAVPEDVAGVAGGERTSPGG